MWNSSKVIRWSALPLAFTMVATVAHAEKTYSGPDTSLGTLSSTPIYFGDPSLTSGASFNESWTFSIPAGSTGADGYLVGLNLSFGGTGLASATLIDLLVTVNSVPITLGADDGFSFSDPPGHYTLDISGTTASGTNSFYTGAIAAVPEPATWGLMLAGIAVCAGVARRRVS